jgi:hypothetical protein
LTNVQAVEDVSAHYMKMFRSQTLQSIMQVISFETYLQQITCKKHVISIAAYAYSAFKIHAGFHGYAITN